MDTYTIVWVYIEDDWKKCKLLSNDQNKYVNGKSEVIYNGYDPEDFKNKKSKKLLNRKNIIISHIGTLSKSQNPKGLFNSVKKYNQSIT